jgi:hypothetical protein
VEIKREKLVNDVVAVSRLKDVLIYTLTSAVFSFMSIAFHFGLTIAIIAAILFTTYILYVLIKEKRFGWLITFFIMVVLPVIITYLVSRESLFSVMAIILIPFSLFYLYCFLLRYALDYWIEECEGKIELEEEKENEAKKVKKTEAAH